jgi:hypothetical protein
MASGKAREDDRLTFQEQLELVELPVAENSHQSLKRYMSTRQAWLPGVELEVNFDSAREGKTVDRTHLAAYGGQVYAQGALATCRALADDEKARGVEKSRKLGLHVGSFSVC